MPTWLPTAVTIGLFVATTVNGIIGWALREQWKRIENLEKSQGEMRKDLNELKAQLPFIYVPREEWIRAQTTVERKLDDILKELWRRNHSAAGSDGGDD
ncbi:MAG: hypothetical protein ACOY94_19665 [Bacillota bacterium]